MPAHAAGPRHSGREPVSSHPGGPGRPRRGRRFGAVALAVTTAVGVGLVSHVAMGGAAEPVAQPSGPSSLSVQASADTYVSYGAPSNLRGTSTRLTAGSKPGDEKVIYLRFGVGVPAGTTISKARLLLTRDEHHLAGDVTVRTVSSADWDENTLTARNAPKVGDALDTMTTGRDTTQVNLDVTAAIVKSGTYSLAVTAAMPADVARFRSREFGSSGPVLQLSLTGRPAPGPLPTGSTAPTIGPITPSPTKPTAPPTSTPPSSSAPAPTAPAPPTGPGGRPSCGVSAKLVPDCGRWWGVVPRAFSGDQNSNGLRINEAAAQRQFDVFHAYHVNDQLFPTADERSIALEPGRNRLLYLNWKPATDLTWRQVANGGADARIDREAANIKATYPYKFFMTIWHEPENDVNATPGSGKTAADFAAMFRHTVQRMRAAGATNVVFVMNYMGYSRWNNAPWFNQLYPGDDVVDWIGWDPYASGAASGYWSGDFAKMVNRTDGQPFPGFYTWASSTHPSKPLMLGEWGVTEDTSNPAGKAKFFDSVARQISQFPNFKALFYFDTKHDQIGPFGDTSIDSSPTTLAAFQALSHNSAFMAPQVVNRP
jgi:hypothetical protein